MAGKKPCEVFRRDGTLCTRGESCRYSHDKETLQSSRMTMCLYFWGPKRRCREGDLCPFAHSLGCFAGVGFDTCKHRNCYFFHGPLKAQKERKNFVLEYMEKLTSVVLNQGVEEHSHRWWFPIWEEERGASYEGRDVEEAPIEGDGDGDRYLRDQDDISEGHSLSRLPPPPRIISSDSNRPNPNPTRAMLKPNPRALRDREDRERPNGHLESSSSYQQPHEDPVAAYQYGYSVPGQASNYYDHYQERPQTLQPHPNYDAYIPDSPSPWNLAAPHQAGLSAMAPPSHIANASSRNPSPIPSVPPYTQTSPPPGSTQQPTAAAAAALNGTSAVPLGGGDLSGHGASRAHPTGVNALGVPREESRERQELHGKPAGNYVEEPRDTRSVGHSRPASPLPRGAPPVSQRPASRAPPTLRQTDADRVETVTEELKRMNDQTLKKVLAGVPCFYFLAFEECKSGNDECPLLHELPDTAEAQRDFVRAHKAALSAALADNWTAWWRPCLLDLLSSESGNQQPKQPGNKRGISQQKQTAMPSDEDQREYAGGEEEEEERDQYEEHEQRHVEEEEEEEEIEEEEVIEGGEEEEEEQEEEGSRYVPSVPRATVQREGNSHGEGHEELERYQSGELPLSFLSSRRGGSSDVGHSSSGPSGEMLRPGRERVKEELRGSDEGGHSSGRRRDGDRVRGRERGQLREREHPAGRDRERQLLRGDRERGGHGAWDGFGFRGGSRGDGGMGMRERERERDRRERERSRERERERDGDVRGYWAGGGEGRDSLRERRRDGGDYPPPRSSSDWHERGDRDGDSSGRRRYRLPSAERERERERDSALASRLAATGIWRGDNRHPPVSSISPYRGDNDVLSSSHPGAHALPPPRGLPERRGDWLLHGGGRP
uniref:C3H1-type domain-containing protein n=1 Tax=Chromera velia CCMP2878 TaxID=1169474 RepID=A0A0G4H1N8_9ALVE|eukprot:Cvel_24326.t1-p1 / transcript=Cvel_24326.t1 / gene=Cvel_24326 / organism=Chromera_velia_CCMP2878 / gene_product=hypothetical protein / transcript_product=hypothetical protein / location=Cvel_scaffold2615:14645-20381(-) / protein_length=888 / sequence_SO=supercontig / SO=protein_coding / is_pseudo=false